MTDDELLTGRSDRFRAAIAAIDAANAGDPEVVVVEGAEVPKELAHARMMCDWILRLDPDADELQLIAARAHHLRRWALPRSDFPEGRSGYLRWRTAQKKRHAADVGRLMGAAGYGPADTDRVAAIVRKQGLADDPAVQTHEDALCLVFLGTQFDHLAGRLGQEKMVDVLAKTMKKMSPAGLAAAAGVGLDDRARALLDRAQEQLDQDADTDC